jgi:hypothetical protein
MKKPDILFEVLIHVVWALACAVHGICAYRMILMEATARHYVAMAVAAPVAMAIGARSWALAPRDLWPRMLWCGVLLLLVRRIVNGHWF